MDIFIRVFANGSGDLSSIPGRIILKTQKMVFDAVLLTTQHYKVRIKGKVEQYREGSSALSYTSVLYLLKRERSGQPQLRLPNLLPFRSLMRYRLSCVECSPIVWENGVLSQVESYQRLKNGT